MRRVLFVLVWLIVLAAASYDAHFAWRYREAMEEWELNPLARWAAREVGLVAIFCFKFAGLAFAAGLASYCVRRQLRGGWPLTLAVLGLYTWLSLHYVVELNRPLKGPRRLPADSAQVWPLAQLWD
jgi:hypothetical protein